MAIHVLKALASPCWWRPVLPSCSPSNSRAVAALGSRNCPLSFWQSRKWILGVKNRVAEEPGQFLLRSQIHCILQGLQHLWLDDLIQEVNVVGSKLWAVGVIKGEDPALFSCGASSKMLSHDQKPDKLRSWLASHRQQDLALVVRVNKDRMVLQLKSRSEKEQSSGRVLAYRGPRHVV